MRVRSKSGPLDLTGPCQIRRNKSRIAKGGFLVSAPATGQVLQACDWQLNRSFSILAIHRGNNKWPAIDTESYLSEKTRVPDPVTWIPVTPPCMVRDGVQCALLDSSFTSDDLAVFVLERHLQKTRQNRFYQFDQNHTTPIALERVGVYGYLSPTRFPVGAITWLPRIWNS